MPDFGKLVADFFRLVAQSQIEIYNEFMDKRKRMNLIDSEALAHWQRAEARCPLRIRHSQIGLSISLQHELGIYIRTNIGADYKIQFERPTSFFGIERFGLEKKEIDISVFDRDPSSKYAVELKYPRNGRHPETMFDFCKDIRFLEQLAAGGFLRCYFVAVVDDSLFYEGKNTTGIYQYFRSDKPIHGVIEKPTGKNKYPLEIAGSYRVEWQPLKAAAKYFLVEIGC